MNTNKNQENKVKINGCELTSRELARNFKRAVHKGMIPQSYALLWFSLNAGGYVAHYDEVKSILLKSGEPMF